MPNYAIVNDRVVELTSSEIPSSMSGLLRIVGKKTENDRKWVMKVDPTLVREKLNGKETENLGRATPIMVYDFADMAKRGRQFDAWAVNAVCFLLGAGGVASLYFWHIIEIFASK
jgi:hypothetical protein